MGERNIVEMVEALRGGKNKTESSCNVLFAEVSGVMPLLLTISGQAISKNIYISPSLILEASDGQKNIEELFINAPEPAELFYFLKEFHEKYIIASGDTVIVIQSGASFYVASKVVKVG